MAIALLIAWYIQNDEPGLKGGHKGLFAMEDEGAKDRPRREKGTGPKWRIRG
jgi:hypothetical protein